METKIEFKIEIIIGTFGLLVTILLPKIGLSQDIVCLIGILVVIFPLSMVSLKIFLNKIIKKAIRDASATTGKTYLLAYKISNMSEPKISFARDILNITIEKIDKVEKGIIPLSEADYFDRIIEEAKNLKKNNVVCAVNSFDERRFEHDPRERIYFEENIKAIRERGAIIKRIFIYDDRQISTNEGLEKLKAIKKNEDNGINIFIVYKSLMLGKNDFLLDWVMFDCTGTRLYVDYQDAVDETRVSHAELRINESDILKFKRTFKILEEHSISRIEINKLFEQINSNVFEN
jgi:hypothetical protein